MRAAGHMIFGGPEVVEVMELQDPVAREDEVVVKVAASTINPTDLMMRAGQQADLMTHLRPPYVPGVEFAGVVHGVGGPTSTFSIGQRVMGIVNARRPSGGSHAEFVSVPEASIVALEPTIDLEEAATVPMNGLTAKIAIEALGLSPGEVLLVTGGAGAAGGYAIQLANAAGFTVIADAKDSDVDLLRALGAHVIVPRGEKMVAAVRQAFPSGVDGLIDAALLGDRAGALVRDGRTAVSLRRSNPITDARLQTRWINVFEHDKNTTALMWLAEKLRRGQLTPRVAMRLPLSEAREAHRMAARGGLRGRIELLMT